MLLGLHPHDSTRYDTIVLKRIAWRQEYKFSMARLGLRHSISLGQLDCEHRSKQFASILSVLSEPSSVVIDLHFGQSEWNDSPGQMVDPWLQWES